MARSAAPWSSTKWRAKPSHLRARRPARHRRSGTRVPRDHQPRCGHRRRRRHGLARGRRDQRHRVRAVPPHGSARRGSASLSALRSAARRRRSPASTRAASVSCSAITAWRNSRRATWSRAPSSPKSAPTKAPACLSRSLAPRRSASFASRFPRIYETCLRYGIDLDDPACARASGGALRHGRRAHRSRWAHQLCPASIAAGEAACTGVHGANRLASNSLLEGVVFGARAGQAMRAAAPVLLARTGGTAGAEVPLHHRGSRAPARLGKMRHHPLRRTAR